MLLFFTGAQITVWGRRIKTLEDGHRILMERAIAQLDSPLPPAIDPAIIILGNHRADLPHLRPDGTISLWGIAWALMLAQTVPKYHHGMRQSWHHPTRNLHRVQQAFYQRFLRAVITPLPALAAEYLGGALHTLQDTYTIGHTERQNNADPYSPLIRLHYSPSKNHPFISPNDRVWADEQKNTLTPEAQAAITATVAALELWQHLWNGRDSQKVTDEQLSPLVAFINRYLPLENCPFAP